MKNENQNQKQSAEPAPQGEYLTPDIQLSMPKEESEGTADGGEDGGLKAEDGGGLLPATAIVGVSHVHAGLATSEPKAAEPETTGEGTADVDRNHRDKLAVSPRKREANRRNALKSTGPTSVEGKAAAKMNALKYGTLANSVVVRSRIMNESAKEFKELCREFHESLAPVGPLEEMLTGQIVAATWRLRRARHAEAGEIALSVDDGEWKRSLPPEESLLEKCGLEEDPVPALNNSKDGCSTLIRWLLGVRAAVEADGELTEAALQIPNDGKPNRLSAGLERFWNDLPAKTKGLGAAAHRKEMKGRLVSQIDLHIEAFRARLMECSQRECAEENARRSAAMIPTDLILDKILRYETALERQLFRAMNQLERLQRRRAGEYIPAPVTMTV